ncbi:uncharacterized protein LOC141619411 [Silene latifolia]|uniref:uncharacterized protein LOC141619411 n=1 Tax=Silene latifolia TaxID=37657 RepID=UPI003D780871
MTSSLLVISKLLCNRLSVVLPDLVSENQGTFIKGRMLLFATDRWPFQYHPLCKSIKLNHLMFADDLLMFCKGNVQSIMLMMRAFSSFSKASGLSMNNSKSEVYYNGVAQALKDDIKQVTGFTEGAMPFRYLGVPVQATRLTKIECNILVEKMVNKIRSLGAKKLSYAGRLVLVNSVLNTLHNYWSGIFLIPKCVVKRIEAVCRNYLWDGSADYHRVPSVGWDNVTLPKEEGGLGIKRTAIWKIASVAKLVDWLYCKADRLWIRWVNQVAYVEDQWTPDSNDFTIRHCYEWLRHRAAPQNWAPGVWNSWNVPKHSCITWMSMNNGLNTRAKLASFGYCQEQLCCICESSPENQEHLFFQCEYSQQVLQEIKKWCGFRVDVIMAGL